MHIYNNSFLVTGGASRLSAAVVRSVNEQGGKLIIADLNTEAGQALADELGEKVCFIY